MTLTNADIKQTIKQKHDIKMLTLTKNIRTIDIKNADIEET